MLQAPVFVVAILELKLGEFCSLCLLALTTALEKLEVFLVFSELLLSLLLPFDPASLVEAYLVVALLPPHNLSQLDVLQHHIDLLEFGIIDHFQEADHVGMSDLLENSNLPLCLVLR